MVLLAHRSEAGASHRDTSPPNALRGRVSSSPAGGRPLLLLLAWAGPPRCECDALLTLLLLAPPLPCLPAALLPGAASVGWLDG